MTSLQKKKKKNYSTLSDNKQTNSIKKKKQQQNKTKQRKCLLNPLPIIDPAYINKLTNKQTLMNTLANMHKYSHTCINLSYTISE